MKTTVALDGQIFDLRTPERADEAEAWVARNRGDTSGFKDQFPEAQVLASVLGDTCYHVFGEATGFGDGGWIPSVRVVFAHEDGSAGCVMRDLPELGTFGTAGKAQDRAAAVQVQEIKENGAIVFTHERQ